MASTVLNKCRLAPALVPLAIPAQRCVVSATPGWLGRTKNPAGESNPEDLIQSNTMTMTLNVNGTNYQVSITDEEIPLLWVLRDLLGLTGTKYGCGIQACGACMVLIDGQPEFSCVYDATSAKGKRITTIEGLSPDNTHPVQAAWQSTQIPQCGYCQSGMIMAAAGAIRAGHRGKEILPEIKNLCVCGTYQRIRNTLKTL